MFAASKSGKAAAGVSPTTDASFAYVPLLLETTGTNGQQNNTFLDSSTNNFTITRNGTPTQGSRTPYWPAGQWSNYFNGSTDYLTFANNAAFTFGTNDFTVETWIYPTGTGSGTITIASIVGGNQSSASYWNLYFNTSTNVISWYGNDAVLRSTSNTVSLNTWNHVAVSRTSGVLKIFINGVQGYSASVATSYSLPTNGARIAFDGPDGVSTGNKYFLGYISNLRVVNGTGVYTTAFTPSTTPLTAITNTGLLTCQSNRFKDNSTNNFTIASFGTPTVQAFQPFSPAASYSAATYAGSGYFNGSTDYLTAASNAAFAFGTGDYTVEGWLYSFSTSQQVFFTSGGTGTNNFYFSFAPASSYIGVGNQAVFVLQATGLTLSLNVWHHVAASRSSGTLKLFLNGVQVASGADSTNWIQGGLTSVGNNSANSQYFSGYISNFRVVKGTAVYTGNFTPPTLAPLTTAGSTSAASYPSTTNVNTSFASSNTSLLLNMANAGIYDAAAQNNMTTVGDAQASTTQSKWSPTSMKYDGTGDWLTAVDGPQLQLGTGDFTIEGWVYLSAVGVAYGIISKGAAATGWSVNVTSGNKLQFSYTASNLTGATSLAATTWYYFAVVRSGSATGNLKVYLNGTADATSGGAVTDNFNQTSILYVGADRVGGSALNGYLQDVRITKAARTITTPTAAFPTR
jgi:hypothetical protein